MRKLRGPLRLANRYELITRARLLRGGESHMSDELREFHRGIYREVS
jgi:hypothetical protein